MQFSGAEDAILMHDQHHAEPEVHVLVMCDCDHVKYHFINEENY